MTSLNAVCAGWSYFLIGLRIDFTQRSADKRNSPIFAYDSSKDGTKVLIWYQPFLKFFFKLKSRSKNKNIQLCSVRLEMFVHVVGTCKTNAWKRNGNRFSQISERFRYRKVLKILWRTYYIELQNLQVVERIWLTESAQNSDFRTLWGQWPTRNSDLLH